MNNYRRRRVASVSMVALTDTRSNTENEESTKKPRSRFTRNHLRYGYRKQVWRKVVVGKLGIAIAVGIFCGLHNHSHREWNWKFLYVDNPFTALNSTSSSTAVNHQPANGYEWDWNIKDPTDIPYISSRRKSIFTALTKQGKDKLRRMKEDFEKLKSTGMLLPCRIDEGDSCFREIKPSIAEYYLNKFLRSSSTTTGTGGRSMLLHNPLPEDRFWCGRRILGGGGTLEVMSFPHQCRGERNEGSLPLPYVYSERPPTIPKKGVSTDDDNEKTVELFWNMDEYDITPYKSKRHKTEPFPCSVPCKLNNNYNVLNEISVRNTNWRITHTMEGEQIYPEARVRPSAYRESNFYATTSFKSEIPLPYFSWKEYKIQHAAVDFQKVIKGASFLAANCETFTEREKLVYALIETPLRVDSLSVCLHNADPPPGVDTDNKTAVMEQYLFHLAFENQETDDYITEKLWGALASGTLPVYLGAKNIKEHIPKNSIIIADDFESPQNLADYLIRLTNDKDLYESYHTWRYQTIDDAFASKYEFTNTHSNCRMCKWVFAKRHGLGWNHSKQTISKPRIDHKTCRNEMGLIGYPFKEYWLSSTPSPGGGGDASEEESETRVFSMDATKTCTLTEENRVLEVDHGAIRRKVYDRDGVSDLIIDVTTGAATAIGAQSSNAVLDHYILRLGTPIKAEGTNQKPHVVSDLAWWLQDDQSRFYVMASGGGVNLSIHKPGIIEIYIPTSPRSTTNSSSTTTTRVRVVTENMDHFHTKTKNTPSYFGDLMMRDFFEPVASYKIT